MRLGALSPLHPFLCSGPRGERVPSQVMEVPSETRRLQAQLAHVNATDPARDGAAVSELVFQAQLPPLGYARYTVEAVEGDGDGSAARHAQPITDGASEAVLENDRVKLVFSTKDGAVGAVTNLGAGRRRARGIETMRIMAFTRVLSEDQTQTPSCSPCAGLLQSATVDGMQTSITTHMAWYNSSDGLDVTENRGQASGAYIFRCGLSWVGSRGISAASEPCMQRGTAPPWVLDATGVGTRLNDVGMIVCHRAHEPGLHVRAADPTADTASRPMTRWISASSTAIWFRRRTRPSATGQPSSPGKHRACCVRSRHNGLPVAVLCSPLCSHPVL